MLRSTRIKQHKYGQWSVTVSVWAVKTLFFPSPRTLIVVTGHKIGMCIHANRLSCSSSVVLRTWYLQLKGKTNCWRWAMAEKKKKLKRKVLLQLPWVTQSLIPAAEELLCNMTTFPPLREWAFVWLFALFSLGVIDHYHWIAGLMLDLTRQGPFALTLTLICKYSGSLQLSAPKQSLACSVL